MEFRKIRETYDAIKESIKYASRDSRGGCEIHPNLKINATEGAASTESSGHVSIIDGSRNASSFRSAITSCR